MKRIIIVFFLSFYSVATFGQDAVLWSKYRQQYPEDAALFLEREEVVTISIEQDSLRILEEHKEDILFLKDQGESYAHNKIYGSHFNEVKKMSAKTLVWDKTKYKELAVNDFQKRSNQDNSIFHDDSHYYTFNYPSIASQNRSVLAYSVQLKDPRFLGGFIMASYIPQVKVRYVIKAHKSIELAYEVINDRDNRINFNKTIKGDYITYEWSGENLNTLKFDSNSPSIRYYVPHVVCYIKSYTTKKGKINVLGDLNDLHNWYRTFLSRLDDEAPADMLAVVNNIVEQSNSKDEIAKKIYYWVQQNIKYIAFEQGMRGLIPHSGSYVFEKRYGDCKDMASLLVSMLKLANIEAYYTWIGTRDIPYKYSQFPTPLVDNHMIATYISDNQQYCFLDATSDYTTFGLPSSMIQGKEAFIHRAPDKYEIALVPEIERTINVTQDTIQLKLDKNEVVGKGTLWLSGFPKTFGAYELDRSDEKTIKENLTKLLVRGNNKFYVDQYTISALNELDKPTEINYQFRIADYFQRIGDELYLNMNFRKDYYNDFINTKIRNTPRENEYKYTENEYYELTLPEGYQVSYLPPNEVYENELLGFSVSYKQIDKKIILSKSFYINFLLLEPEQFDSWNNSVKKLSDTYRQSVILKKNQ